MALNVRPLSSPKTFLDVYFLTFMIKCDIDKCEELLL